MGGLRFKRWFGTVCLVAAVALWSAGTVYAAGFAIMEQGVKELGTAYAGGAASALDATTVYYNPAGMSLLNGTQVSAGFHLIKTSFKFSNEGSTTALTPLTGQGLTGNDGGDGGMWNAVPLGYFTTTLDNGISLGFGVGVPFGLTTKYSPGWVGRYYTQRSKIFTINLNPSVAYAVSDKLSVGAGFDAMYMKGEFSQAIDFGTLLAAAGDVPQHDDGYASLTADDWSYGYNLGVLYQFDDATRVGLAYRSRVKQNLSGSVDFTVPSTAAAILSALPAGSVPQFKSGAAGANVTLPDSATLSLYHELNSQWAVMADVGWMNWSTLKELRIYFADPSQPDSVTTLDWRDTWRFSLGASYHANPRWDFRFGTMYDQTPIRSAETRTPRLPDQDRVWTTLGTTYHLTQACAIDLAYAHLFMVGNSRIDKNATGENIDNGGLKGSYDNMGDIVSAQINYVW